MVSIGFDTMRSPCSALNVKVLRNSRHARANGRSNYESQKGSHVCSECQSNGNRKQAWVNGGRSHDSSQASQRSDCQSEWALLQLGFSSRWRARRATSYRRRGAGRSRGVAAASRRCGRNGRRAGPGEARFLNLANLARQSSCSLFRGKRFLSRMRPDCTCWATSRRRSTRRALQVCLS